MATSDGGKGDTYRPIENRDQFDKNWDAIFGNKKPVQLELDINADNESAEVDVKLNIPLGE